MVNRQEYHFPTFKERFSFYQAMPHDYFFYMKDSDLLKWGMYGYRSSKNSETKFYFKEQEERNEASKKDQISILRVTLP